MAWCVGNAKVEPKGQRDRDHEAGLRHAKIDPLMALFNAASLMAQLFWFRQA
jgi:phage terminase large subunit-like protein